MRLYYLHVPSTVIINESSYIHCGIDTSLIYCVLFCVYVETIPSEDRVNLPLLPCTYRDPEKVVYTYFVAPSDTLLRLERYFFQTDKISCSIPTFSAKSTKHRAWIMSTMMSCAID